MQLALIRSHSAGVGEPLPDDSLEPSDLILPSPDATLEEASNASSPVSILASLAYVFALIVAIDNPSGVGDYEMLPNFLGQGACPQPLAIECRTTGGRDWTTTGQAYTCDKATGGYCVNRQQPFGKPCQDYEVRFLCPAS